MLKKVITLAMAATLSISLVACGNSGDKPSGVKDIDLAGFGTTLTSKHELPEQLNLSETLGKDVLNIDYPGLADVDVQELVAYKPVMDVGGGEVVLVETKSEEDATKVQGIFQTLIDNKVAGGAFYPAAVELWTNNAAVVTKNNCVMLVAHADKDAIVEEFNALFK